MSKEPNNIHRHPSNIFILFDEINLQVNSTIFANDLNKAFDVSSNAIEYNFFKLANIELAKNIELEKNAVELAGAGKYLSLLNRIACKLQLQLEKADALILLLNKETCTSGWIAYILEVFSKKKPCIFISEHGITSFPVYISLRLSRSSALYVKTFDEAIRSKNFLLG